MIAEVGGTIALVSLSAFGSVRLSAYIDEVIDSAFFDSRHNVNTSAVGRHAPSTVRTLRSLLGALPIAYQDSVFVDLGSGKGRALLVAAELPFKRCIGIERSHALHEIAQANLRGYRGGALRCPQVEPQCLDATDFEFPDEPCVIYMFNPFPRGVLERIAVNLERSYQRGPRFITVIYMHPSWSKALANLPFLQRTDLSGTVTDYFEVFSNAV
jgi:SAM-dependent methyltransferase